MHGIAVVAILGRLALTLVAQPTNAEILALSGANAGLDKSDAEEIWCYYSKGGIATISAFDTVSLYVKHDKSIIDRLLNRRLSDAERRTACPENVNRYPSEATQPEGYDNCVLKHMQGANSDAAAFAVQQSCVRTTEAALPAIAFVPLGTARAVFWTSPFFDGKFGLYVTLNNSSDYTITELVVAVEDKSTHVVERYNIHDFPRATAGATGVITGPPADRTSLILLRAGLQTFYVPISQLTTDPKKWADNYQWAIISAKGFHN